MYIPKREGEKEQIQHSNQKRKNRIGYISHKIIQYSAQIHVEQERKPSAHKYKNFNQKCICKEYRTNIKKEFNFF
jgi:hypothetical protein